MIKVARVASDPFFMAVHLKGQLELMQKSGFQLSLITSPESSLCVSLPVNLSKCQCPIKFTRSITPWQDLKSLIALYRNYKSNQYDLVHSNGPKAGLLSAIAGWLARVPIRLHTFTGQPWLRERGLKRWLLKACDRLIIYLNTQCYADSFGQAEFLFSQKLVNNPQQIKVLGHGSLSGVDLVRYNPTSLSDAAQAIRQRLNVQSNNPLLAFVGRITADKGIEVLLDALLQVRQKCPNVRLLLVGPLEADGADCLKLLDQPELSGCVHHIGYTDHPEVYLAAADVLVLPSYREGFGTVILEAAALGKPAIASNIYGLNEAVVDQQTGLLFAPGCVAALVQAMTELITNELRAKCMGGAAQERVRTCFDSKQVNQYVVDEYSRLLSRK